MMYKYMCKNLLFLLFIFTFIQIQLSWRRDEIISHKPWMVLWKGYTKDCSVETGNDFFFNAEPNSRCKKCCINDTPMIFFTKL